MQLFETKHDFTTSLRKSLKDIDPKWESYFGLIIPGSHKPTQIEDKIKAIHHAREHNTPFLGICLGHQLAAIEYARNVLGIKDATSEEFGQGTFVVKKRRDGLNVGERNGQSWWNNYEVVIPVDHPSYFFTSQFHPEYQSSKENPHPLLLNFIQACRTVV